MLLRRIIEHVKAQNWTAVGLDFVIVVVGVFIGIQVANWNDVRRDRVQEQVYVQRLHDEAEAGLNGLVGFVEQYYAERIEHYYRAIEILTDPAHEATALSDIQCDVIGNMHDFIALPFQFPSLEEMNATGQLDLIRNEALRARLTRYRLMHDQNRALIENLNTALAILPNEFPDYFDARLARAPAGRDLTYGGCDADAMRADKAFLNRFADTASRYFQYYSIVIQREAVAVKNLHGALDEALGVAHANDA